MHLFLVACSQHSNRSTFTHHTIIIHLLLSRRTFLSCRTHGSRWLISSVAQPRCLTWSRSYHVPRRMPLYGECVSAALCEVLWIQFITYVCLVSLPFLPSFLQGDRRTGSSVVAGGWQAQSVSAVSHRIQVQSDQDTQDRERAHGKPLIRVDSYLIIVDSNLLSLSLVDASRSQVLFFLLILLSYRFISHHIASHLTNPCVNRSSSSMSATSSSAGSGQCSRMHGNTSRCLTIPQSSRWMTTDVMTVDADIIPSTLYRTTGPTDNRPAVSHRPHRRHSTGSTGELRYYSQAHAGRYCSFEFYRHV